MRSYHVLKVVSYLLYLFAVVNALIAVYVFVDRYFVPPKPNTVVSRSLWMAYPYWEYALIAFVLAPTLLVLANVAAKYLKDV